MFLKMEMIHQKNAQGTLENQLGWRMAGGKQHGDSSLPLDLGQGRGGPREGGHGGAATQDLQGFAISPISTHPIILPGFDLLVPPLCPIRCPQGREPPVQRALGWWTEC